MKLLLLMKLFLQLLPWNHIHESPKNQRLQDYESWCNLIWKFSSQLLLRLSSKFCLDIPDSPPLSSNSVFYVKRQVVQNVNDCWLLFLQHSMQLGSMAGNIQTRLYNKSHCQSTFKTFIQPLARSDLCPLIISVNSPVSCLAPSLKLLKYFLSNSLWPDFPTYSIEFWTRNC